jgi:hypothetical protein
VNREELGDVKRDVPISTVADTHLHVVSFLPKVYSLILEKIRSHTRRIADLRPWDCTRRRDPLVLENTACVGNGSLVEHADYSSCGRPRHGARVGLLNTLLETPFNVDCRSPIDNIIEAGFIVGLARASLGRPSGDVSVPREEVAHIGNGSAWPIVLAA